MMKPYQHFDHRDFERQGVKRKGTRTHGGIILERIWIIDHGLVSAVHQGRLSVHESKEWAYLGGKDLRAQIYGKGSILEPPRHSTFKEGGGGGGRGGLQN
jgi:hypothetical protein